MSRKTVVIKNYSGAARARDFVIGVFLFGIGYAIAEDDGDVIWGLFWMAGGGLGVISALFLRWQRVK